MRAGTLALVAALLLPAAALHAAKRDMRTTFGVSAAVEVDASGRVTEARIVSGSAPKSVSDPLEAEIRSWEFEPAMVDGRAAASSAHVHVSLRADPVPGQADAFAVRVVAANVAPGKRHAPAPRYPMSAIRSRAVAQVVLAVDVGPDGRVTGVREQSVRTNRGKEMSGTLFVRYSTDAVREWEFVPEQVEGHPVATTVLVPIQFCIDGMDCFDDGEAPSTEIASENPVTRLKSDVVGRTL